MSADLLRRAAATLREHGNGASPSPWDHVDYHGYSGDQSTFMGCGSIISMHPDTMGGDIAAPNGDCYPRGGYSPFEDMKYIALMHPPVAFALAAWLDAAAAVVEGNDEHDGFDLDAVDDTYRGALATARAVLREAPDA